MEDGVLSPGTMLHSSIASAMDFDYMDELLFDGCWLETTDGSEFLNPSPPTYFGTSFLWPTPETQNGDSNSGPSQKDDEQEKHLSPLPGNLPQNDLQGRIPVNIQPFNHNVARWENNVTEASEISRSWWIEPTANPGSGTSVRERLIKALGYIQEFAKDKDALIQIWVPTVNRGGKRVLTTQDQPFALDPTCPKLARYRDISVNYQFSAEENSRDMVGLPGRVFLGKVPEWTPDVRFFRSDEYPRVDYAQRYDVCGTLALPVFEQGSRTCLGVIEVVTTTQKINYNPELESVCKALEAVDLRSSKVLREGKVKAFSDVSYQTVLTEILAVLKSACDTHKLPLAQTWVPCIQQGREGSRHSDDNYCHCVSTVDCACYVADPVMQGFHEACSEHHLLKGQGVAGQAFMTNQPCFSTDITSVGKTEYPLSHHARMFQLRAAVAIRLRSEHTGAADFVLEFFLPVECIDLEEQKKMLNSLSIIIRQVYQTLRVVTDEELMEEPDLLLSEMTIASDGRITKEMTVRARNPSSERKNQENHFNKGNVEHSRDPKFADGSTSHVSIGKTGERKRAKAEKTITLQVLRQYFAGSLKDAAKNIGVCPTTLKRICRQHGITRWPSRKIKKVGHSLQKLKYVMDSVQGASGALQIGSFYRNFPELASSNSSGTGALSNSVSSDCPKQSSTQLEGGIIISQSALAKSRSSSCSQSSSSSHCCSSGSQQHPSTSTLAASEDASLRENSVNCMLKRVRSNAELHTSSQGRSQKLLPRSQSHENLKEQATLKNVSSLPKSSYSSEDIDAHRVKISYGSENIRLRMPNNWARKDLIQEIARRFNIDDMSGFDLKYLDDDCEWVLLTCDDDLEECIDVYRSSQNNTIKLSLQVSPHRSGRSLGSSDTS